MTHDPGKEADRILQSGMVLCLFGYIPFMYDDTSIIVFALLYGATFLVTAPLTVVFAEQAVGRALMGWVSGILTMVHHIAGGIGAFLGGRVFDRWGSYNKAFMTMSVLSLVALCMGRLDAQPPGAHGTSETDGRRP